MIRWAECRNGHQMVDDSNVYVTPDGHRRCRTCKRESDLRTRAKRTANRYYPPPVRVRPNKYRAWAETVWDEMNERERQVVAYALGYMSIEEAVT